MSNNILLATQVFAGMEVSGYSPAELATFGENLKRLRERAGLTQEELAEKLGLKRPTPISVFESGRKKGTPKAANVVRYARAVGCDPRELLEGVTLDHDHLRGPSVSNVGGDRLDVSGHKFEDIPVIREGEASPQGHLFWSEDGELLSNVERRITRPHDVKEQRAYGIEIRGDSMRPKYEPGQVVVVSPNRPVGNGHPVYVELHTGERLVKIARRIPGGWSLESSNPAYEPRLVKKGEVGVMHRIVWTKEKD